EIQVMLQQCQHRSRLAELEEARRREWERQQAIQAEMERRQWELARAAEAARLRAEQEAAALAEADRLRRAQQCERAQRELSVQAQAAFQSGNFEVSVSLFESALASKHDDDGYRQLALARARAQEAARARAAEAQARREAELRRQREAEVAQLR